MAIRLVALRLPRRRGIAELAQLGRKCGLNRLGIRCREAIFVRKHPMGPSGESLRFIQLRQLRDQLLSKVFGSLRRQSCWLGLFRTRSLFRGLQCPARLWRHRDLAALARPLFWC